MKSLVLFQYVIYRVTEEILCSTRKELHTMNSEHGSLFSHKFNGTVHGIKSFCINMKTAKYIMKMNTFNDTLVLYH
jgi:hypothetical protein